MDIFFVEDPSIKQRVKARSFVAKNALKRRIRQQEAAKNTSSTLLCSPVVDGLRSRTSHFDEAGSRQEAIDVLLPLPESRPVALTLDEPRTIATTNNGESRKPKGIWGVSSAICPNPAHAARSAFRNSAVASFIQEASNMFQKAKFAKMNGAGEQNRLHISALTSRGEAMKLARQQFSAMDDRQELYISNQTRQNLKAESQFLVILQLVLMDYIFFPKQARAHFAASRRFLRSCQAASDENTIVTKRMPKFIHNHTITQIVVAFDIVHLGPDSLIWERSDLPELQESLRAFMMKLYEAESSMEPVIRRQPLDPQSLVWRSLTKIPGPNPYDRGSYLSESQGQMATILMICSIYLHYQPSSNVPQQSLSDLESAMVSLGDEALLSVLNLAWMMAGGTGLPIDNRRERLYWTTGMLYIFRCQQYPLDDDSDLMKRIDNQSEFTENDVRNACLRFLGGNID